MGIHICYNGSMLEQQQQAMCVVLSNDGKNWSKMHSDVEFTIVETTVAIFGPLSIFKDALSGEQWANILQFDHSYFGYSSSLIHLMMM